MQTSVIYKTQNPPWKMKRKNLSCILKIQSDHKILARRSYLDIVNKKENLPNSGHCLPADHQVKMKESEKRDK